MIKIIIAGFGGQGVIFTGNVLAHTCIIEGKQVMLVPSYGPEMRGGTANCTVVMNDEEIFSPIVNHPDILVALNQPSLDRFESSMAGNGHIFYNSSICTPDKNRRKDVSYHGVPATDMATQLGNIRVANMILMGAILHQTGLLKTTSITQKILPNLLKGKKASLLEINRKALKAGISYDKKNGHGET